MHYSCSLVAYCIPGVTSSLLPLSCVLHLPRPPPTHLPPPSQVSLYLLLMEVRYQLGLPPSGLLWNVNSQSMVLVPAKQEELAALLSCRNRLAAHLWQECPPPPAMLGVSGAAGSCAVAAKSYSMPHNPRLVRRSSCQGVVLG